MILSDIRRVTVIGAGTMGHGIAQVLATCGYSVSLHDVRQEALDQALSRMPLNLRTLVAHGLVDESQVGSIMQRLSTTTELGAALEGSAFVIEAASEAIDIKLGLYREMDRLAAPETVFASNTSGLSITSMGNVTRRADRVVGMHWWNPPHIIPLVEVTKGEKTSDETACLTMDLATSMGKKAVLLHKDVRGFIGNRLQYAMVREAYSLLRKGVASADDIDTAMKYSLGFRSVVLGPIETSDLGGLDVFHSICSYLFEDLENSTEPPQLMAEQVEQGNLGLKTGKGIYNYEKTSPTDIVEMRDHKLLELLRLTETWHR